MEAAWNAALDSWPYSERALYVTTLALGHSVTFWVLNGILCMFHLLGWFEKYKIQGKRMPSGALIREALKQTIINHAVVQFLGLFALYHISVAYGMEMSRQLPSWTTIGWQLLAATVWNDTLFYWGHRLLHHPAIYKYIHKQHHEFKTNVGIASEYAHPVEQVVANFIPTFGALALLGAHPVVQFIWIVIRITETIDTHSGYDFPFSPFDLFSWQGGVERHDFHHSRNVGCFGAFTIFWDWLCGTDAHFLAYQARKAEQKAK